VFCISEWTIYVTICLPRLDPLEAGHRSCPSRARKGVSGRVRGIGGQAAAERIRQTDELIDAVVYRLYGLTEEEMAIVEEKRSQNRIFCSNKRHCPMSKQLLQGPAGGILVKL
jgi:hypothetical protein